jgi:hypothetical protein
MTTHPRPACADSKHIFDKTIDLHSSSDEHQRAVEIARAICHGCPLLTPCRAWAITEARNPTSRYPLLGVVGGTTVADRRPPRKAAA